MHFSKWSPTKNKRLMYVTGPERKLRAKVMASHEDAQTINFTATGINDSDLWRTAFSQSLVQSSKKIIKVYGAENISDWAPLSAWLSRTKATLVFDSDEPFYKPVTKGEDCSRGHACGIGATTFKNDERVCKQCLEAYTLINRKGRLIECFTEADILTGQGLSASQANEFISRTLSVDFSLEALAKFSITESRVDTAVLDVLSLTDYSYLFYDNLIHNNRSAALSYAPLISVSKYDEIFILLNEWLTDIFRVARLHKLGKSKGEIASDTNLSWPKVGEYLRWVNYYDMAEYVRAAKSLAVAEQAYRNKNVTIGILEILALEW